MSRKGGQVGMFRIGQRVKFFTSRGEMKEEGFGRIVKLHKAGRQGSAELTPESLVTETGFKKITRKLQHVHAA